MYTGLLVAPLNSMFIRNCSRLAAPLLSSPLLSSPRRRCGEPCLSPWVQPVGIRRLRRLRI